MNIKNNNIKENNAKKTEMERMEKFKNVSFLRALSIENLFVALQLLLLAVLSTMHLCSFG